MVHLDLKPENVMFKRWQPHIPDSRCSLSAGPDPFRDILYEHQLGDLAAPVPRDKRCAKCIQHTKTNAACALKLCTCPYFWPPMRRGHGRAGRGGAGMRLPPSLRPTAR